MKLSKLLAFAFILLTLLALAACSDKSDPSPEAEIDSQEDQPLSDLSVRTARKTPVTVSELTAKWTELEVYNGEDTVITRAEMAAVINRVFAYKSHSQEIFLDVPSDHKYFSDIQAVSTAGIMTTDSEYFDPDATVSRQDAVVILAAAFCGRLPAAARTEFRDEADINPLALDACSYFEQRGWIGGYEFSPLKGMKWPDLLRILDAMVNDIVTTDGVKLSGDYPAGIVILSDNVVLLEVCVKGDIFISEGVKNLEIIDSVVEGDIFIGRGGGKSNSAFVAITASELGDIYCEEAVTLEIDGTAKVVHVMQSAEIQLSANTVVQGLVAHKAAVVSGAGKIGTVVIRQAAGRTSFQVMPDNYIDASSGVAVGVESGIADLFGDTYYIGADGKLASGFTNIDGGEYYFNSDGIMATGHVVVDLVDYYFDSSGLLTRGWLERHGVKSYYGQTGVVTTGLAEIDGSTYIFDSDGILQTGMFDFEGKKYYAEASGSLYSGEFNYEGETYYAENGLLQSGIIEIDGQLYSFDEDSYQLLKNTTIAGYNVDENGVLTPAVVIYTSGDDELDKMLDEIIVEVTDDSMTLDEQMYAVYKWTADNIHYRATPIDLINGFTQELVAEHGKTTLETRRGACEHFAIVNALLFNRLGVETILIQGYRYSTYYFTWDEHSWLLAKIENKWYHFDTLYELQHTGVPRSVYMKTDAEMESHHRWEADDYPICDGVTEFTD